MTHDFGNTGHGLEQAQKCGSKVSLNQLVEGISMDYWCNKVFDSLWTEKYITSGMHISTGHLKFTCAIGNRFPFFLMGTLVQYPAINYELIIC